MIIKAVKYSHSLWGIAEQQKHGKILIRHFVTGRQELAFSCLAALVIELRSRTISRLYSPLVAFTPPFVDYPESLLSGTFSSFCIFIV
jgi:hypothetical protein